MSLIIMTRTLAAVIVLALASTAGVLAQPGPEWRNLESGQQDAIARDLPLFVFVEADWCGICKRMKRDVFPDPAVMEALSERFVPVRVDLDSKKEVVFNGEQYTERSYAETVGVKGTPTLMFVDVEGELIGGISGYVERDDLLLLFRYISSGAYRDMPFKDYERADPGQ